MSLVPKFLQLPFQFLEVYLINLKLLSNLWKLMLTNIFRLILLFEFLTLECIAYECRTASKCLKGFGLLNQPTKQEPKFQLIGSQLQQCKKSTELSSNILKNGIIFVSVQNEQYEHFSPNWIISSFTHTESPVSDLGVSNSSNKQKFASIIQFELKSVFQKIFDIELYKSRRL